MTEDVCAWSKKLFDQYAAMDAPYIPNDPFAALQVRLCRWERRNFDAASPLHHALGISEELGELYEALGQHDEPEVVDAIGDVLIYATQLATAHRLDFGIILSTQYPGAPLLPISVGRLCHVVLKTSQRIRGYDNPNTIRIAVCGCLLQIVGGLYELGPRDLREIYRTVAERVLQRDWLKDTVTGGEK